MGMGGVKSAPTSNMERRTALIILALAAGGISGLGAAYFLRNAVQEEQEAAYCKFNSGREWKPIVAPEAVELLPPSVVELNVTPGDGVEVLLPWVNGSCRAEMLSALSDKIRGGHPLNRSAAKWTTFWFDEKVHNETSPLVSALAKVYPAYISRDTGENRMVIVGTAESVLPFNGGDKKWTEETYNTPIIIIAPSDTISVAGIGRGFLGGEVERPDVLQERMGLLFPHKDTGLWGWFQNPFWNGSTLVVARDKLYTWQDLDSSVQRNAVDGGRVFEQCGGDDPSTWIEAMMASGAPQFYTPMAHFILGDREYKIQAQMTLMGAPRKVPILPPGSQVTTESIAFVQIPTATDSKIIQDPGTLAVNGCHPVYTGRVKYFPHIRITESVRKNALSFWQKILDKIGLEQGAYIPDIDERIVLPGQGAAPIPDIYSYAPEVKF